MDKLTLAHDYYMQNIKIGKYVSEIEAWNYADDMFEEAEKRKDKTLPDALWQPDWSLAPDWANYWTMDDAACIWWKDEPIFKALSWMGKSEYVISGAEFDYNGHPIDSLRIRPSSK